MSEGPRAWLARAGRNGEREQWALDIGCTPGGYGEVGDLGACVGQGEIRSKLAAVLTSASANQLGSYATQLWTLVDRMAVGDWIVMPRHSVPAFAIGRITGPYSYDEGEADLEKRHVRSVDWIRTDVPRNNIKPDLLNLLNRPPTYFELASANGAGRIEALAMDGSDPGVSMTIATVPSFTWIPFYEEFATRLLAYRDDRGPLLELLLEASRSEPRLRYLNANGFLEGSPGYPPDIDPFTVMGAFNRGITRENRLTIAELLGRAIGVTADTPTDFEGIPVLNNMKSWFIGYSNDRGDDDVEVLWRAFSAGLRLADSDDAEAEGDFVSAYDAAHAVRGVRWNLSVGLYWARPRRFTTLDSRSRPFVRGEFHVDDPADGSSYLALCDLLLASFAEGASGITSFPLLSRAAWNAGQGGGVPHSIEGLATWATRLAESIDMETEEHGFKRKAAALAGESMAQAHAGSPEWAASFKKALNATSTVDFRFKDTLNKAIAADADAALAVLDLVWRAPTPDSLDVLQEGLRSLLGKVTPGNATALGALLLMAVDAEDNAPYSPTRTDRWYHLTDSPGPDRVSSSTSRYATMLGFLDSLRDEMATRPEYAGLTRLEAQGMAWSATEAAPPADWEESQRAALLAWRGQSAEEPRAWLARSTAAAADWMEEGYVSLAATYLGSLEPGASAQDVKAAVEVGYQHEDYSQRMALAQEHHAFLSTMKPGDLIATEADGFLHVGVVDGPAEYVDGEGDRLRRAVAWQSSIAVDDTPPGVSALLDRQGSVVDITESLADLQEIAARGTIIVPPLPPIIRRGEVPPLPPADAKLAQDLHIPRRDLQEIIELLAARQQIVLYGPPGTGKTFIAKAIARHIIGLDDRSRMQLVQFHPSYSYEDFFEGYRPYETDSGQASFTLRPGPLAQIARDARKNPGRPCVLVIDEMNRANLAKVFGELYFLLEYRDESIQLQYRPTEAFRLPRNLFIIGTMNTADRSIALLDAAMRRRFSFVELHPDEPPVNGVLASWLAEGGFGAERARLLDSLNSAIEDQDRDLRIGPSYLMREEAATDEGLRRVWKYDIMPLLEEHYYGRLSRSEIHARFGLDAIRAGTEGIAPQAPAIDVEPDDLFVEVEDASP